MNNDEYYATRFPTFDQYLYHFFCELLIIQYYLGNAAKST